MSKKNILNSEPKVKFFLVLMATYIIYINKENLNNINKNKL